MKKFCTLMYLFLFVSLVNAQSPTDQDCLGAIQVCEITYYQTNSYQGSGNYPNEIPQSGGCPGNCLLSGEKNDVWYRVEVKQSGLLGFEIIPNNISDDYDWVVFDLTNAACEDIYQQGDELQVSCNYSATTGNTGPNGNNTLDCVSASGTPFCKLIPVDSGNHYVINVSNYSSTQYGYTLDFSSSTAQIADTTHPYIDEIKTDQMEMGTDSIYISFLMKVFFCNNVNTGAFTFSGSDTTFTITEIINDSCSEENQYQKQYTMKFEPPIFEKGFYVIVTNPYHGIMDRCGNLMHDNQTFSFTIGIEPKKRNFNKNLSIE